MLQKLCWLLVLFLGLTLSGCSPAQVAAPAEAAAPATPLLPTAAAMQPTAAEATPRPQGPPETCPVTRPSRPPFTPPAPYPASAPEGGFWYGSSKLWAHLPLDGVWSHLPHNPGGYTQKIPFWSEEYSAEEEPEPKLTLEARRLDGPAATIPPQKATNAFTPEYLSMMMSGVDFPTLGCWEMTGRYGEETLTFVVWVAP